MLCQVKCGERVFAHIIRVQSMCITDVGRRFFVEQDYSRDVVLVGHSPDVVDGLRQRPLSYDVRICLPITLSTSRDNIRIVARLSVNRETASRVSGAERYSN